METRTLPQECPFCGRPALRFWSEPYPCAHFPCGTFSNGIYTDRLNPRACQSAANASITCTDAVYPC